MYPKRQFLSLCLAFISTMAWAASTPTILEVKTKTIEVNGHSKVVYTITQPDGTWGYVGTEGQEFNVIVKNETTVPTSIHWHGLILPNAMDGVPGVTQTPIPPGGEYHYQYPLVQAGTFWMHSHMGLQTQDLMEAPFIINAPNDPYKADQQVVVMFQDFSFKNPEAILKQLQSQMRRQAERLEIMLVAQAVQPHLMQALCKLQEALVARAQPHSLRLQVF